MSSSSPLSIQELMEIMSTRSTATVDDSYAVPSHFDATFTWDYLKGRRPALDRLYEKAKRSQWNASVDLDWTTPVDPEAVAAANRVQNSALTPDVSGTSLERWGEKEWVSYDVEVQSWTLSQFLHGEQGALVCCGRIVETVPWIDAKFFAATQVMDEARHVEVFTRYLDDKLTGRYPVNPHLVALLDDIVSDSRWDITYLGMQIMVEGLALAAFGLIRALTTEPLLKELLGYVMADEARHVAFGVLSLQEIYAQLSERELRERQEFAFEAAVKMRDRFVYQEVWERLGVPVADAATVVSRSAQATLFQQLLFSKVVPNCKKLGLLDAGSGWLRQRFADLGVLGYEDDDDGSQGMLEEELTSVDEPAAH